MMLKLQFFPRVLSKIVDKLETVLNVWKQRDLSFIGHWHVAKILHLPDGFAIIFTAWFSFLFGRGGWRM